MGTTIQFHKSDCHCCVCTARRGEQTISSDRRQKLSLFWSQHGHPSYIDGRTSSIRYCIDCNKILSYYQVKSRCKGCWYKYNRGVNSVNYKHGQGNGPYPPEFSDRLKLQIRTRDLFQCTVCHMTEQEHLQRYNRVLEVHHRDGNKLNNSPSNLQTVCKPCNINFIYISK